MSPGQAPRRILVVLLVALACSLLPSASAGTDTLVAPLPLTLEGETAAESLGSRILLAADPAHAPPKHLNLMFTAAEVRIRVYNFTETTTAAGTRVIPNPLEGTSGGSEVLPDEIRNAEFLIKELRPDFFLFVYDGAKAGATYLAYPQERLAALDVTLIEETLSYTEDLDSLDFSYPMPADTFRLSADAMRYEVRGDFTFMLHGATLTTLTADKTYLHRTGTFTETRRVDNAPVPSAEVMRTTTTERVEVEVTDAILTLSATGGRQDVYSDAGKTTLQIDGAIAARSAAGTITVGDEIIQPVGDRVRVEGQFLLTPTYVIPGGGKQVVFSMDGRYTQLAVGGVTYISDEALAVAAATGVTAALVGLGAYFWPTVKGGLIAPLYAKLTRTKVLDLETRNLIHQKVEADPGCQVKQVAEELDISWTTASYHLRVLRKMGLVVARRMGRHEHYFVAGSRAVAGHQVISALQNPTARTIVETVLRHPGIIQKDLCDLIGIAPSTASGHLSRLREIGAIREARDWKKRSYFAGEALQQLPIQLGLATPQPAAQDTAAPAS